MFVEEAIGVVALGYIVILAYKAMENYDVFLKEHGNLADIFTYVSIYFCISQLVMLVLVWICKLISRSRRLIKK